nr:hypothetical protein [Tanacetum cinerariifolium]
MFESSKQKRLKKFAYVNKQGESFLMTEEEIKNQKKVEQHIKVDLTKKEVELGREELVDLLRLEVVENVCKAKMKTRGGWTTIYSQIHTTLKKLHKAKAELKLNFRKPLGEQDPIIKLNELSKKKTKHADDLHEYFMSTKRLHKGPRTNDLARTFSTFLVAEVDKRNMNPHRKSTPDSGYPKKAD